MTRPHRPPRAAVHGKLNAAKRSLAKLHAEGYIAEVCEQWKVAPNLPMGGFRRDLFGFADILAYDPYETGCGVLAVQTTSRQQMSAHLRSYRRDEAVRNNLVAWLSGTSRRFEIHGWEAVEVPCTTRVGTKVRWDCTVRRVTLEDLEQEVIRGEA